MMDMLEIALNKLALFEIVRTKEDSGHVVDTRIEKWKKKRDRLFQRYKEDDTHNRTWLLKSRKLFRRIRKEVKKSINKATQLKATKANTKCFWSMVNKILGKNHKHDISLMLDSEIIKDYWETSLQSFSSTRSTHWQNLYFD